MACIYKWFDFKWSLDFFDDFPINLKNINSYNCKGQKALLFITEVQIIYYNLIFIQNNINLKTDKIFHITKV